MSSAPTSTSVGTEIDGNESMTLRVVLGHDPSGGPGQAARTALLRGRDLRAAAEGVEAALLEVGGPALHRGVPLGPRLVAPVTRTGVAQHQRRHPRWEAQMESQRQVPTQGEATDHRPLGSLQIQQGGHVLHREGLGVPSRVLRRIATAVAADVPGNQPPVVGQGGPIGRPHSRARRIAVRQQQGWPIVEGPSHLVIDANTIAVEDGHDQPAAGAASFSARSALWSEMALPTALIAAPMNCGRFAAAQSRERTARSADPWNAGITSRAKSS